MDRVLLAMTFLAATVQVVVPPLMDELRLEQNPFVYPCFYVPAVIIGISSWMRHGTYARSWGVLGCTLVAWLGMLHTASQGDPTASYEELRTVILLTFALPLGAMIVEHRAWWYCARISVYGCAAVLGILLWLQYGGKFDDFQAVWQNRFGFVIARDGATRLLDPNFLGAQLAFGAILAFMLHVRGGKESRAPGQWAVRRERFHVGWFLFLTGGCFLTASRTAFLAWVIGVTMVFLWGTTRLDSGRLRDLLIQTAIVLSVAVMMTSLGSVTPWKAMFDRFDSSHAEELASFNGRSSIWRTGWQAWRSNSTTLLTGVGLANVDALVGRNSDVAVINSAGVRTLDTHNSFLRWLIGYGVLGAVPLGVVVVSAAIRARRMDARDGTANRQAILLNIFLLAMSNGSFFQRVFWLAIGPLVLAMLSDPVGVIRVAASSPAALVARTKLETPNGPSPRAAVCEPHQGRLRERVPHVNRPANGPRP